MQSNYDNRDFEQFVKQNADQYRMFPSEKVWKGIHSTLHTRPRWYGIGLALLLLLTAGTVTWVMLAPSSGPKQISLLQPANSGTNKNTNTPQKTNPDAVTLNPHHSTNNPNNLSANANGNRSLFEIPLDAVTNRPALNNSELFNSMVATASQPVPPITVSPEDVDEMVATHIEGRTRTIINNIKPVAAKEEIRTTVIDNSPEFVENENQNKKPEFRLQEKKREFYPLSIESVVNSFKAAQKRKKFSVQLYFTPTVSYRKLRENKSYVNSPAFAARGLTNSLPTLTDVNSVVTHKPDLGLELGASAGYEISRNLKLKAGLQFNVRRYDIKSFVYNGEMITLDLKNGMDSLKVWSNHGNLGGYESDWLQNLYFSVSAPVGAELRLSENGKTHMGIAGTIQPTYILGDRAYLISTDYKNYAEVPGLIRHLNLNTSFEAFVGYSTGKLKWQVGPQFRYQLFSSFKQKYPVRENLFDFGLKVGIMLNR